MEISLDLLSKNRSILGFCYNRGVATVEHKKTKEQHPVVFHEIDLGFIVATVTITIWSRLKED
jgi:hypothetical protein